jgi:hypothetical protein
MKLDFMTKILIVATAIIIGTLTFFVTKGIYYKAPVQPPPPMIKIDTVTVTVYQSFPPIVIHGKIDTFYVYVTLDGKPTQQITAEADTSIVDQGDTLNISTRYIFPPDNLFKTNVSWLKHTREIHTTTTNYEVKEVPGKPDLFDMGIMGELAYPNFTVEPELYAALNLGKNSYWAGVSGKWSNQRINPIYKLGAKFSFF